MNKINIQCYKTKIGDLILGSYDNKLCLLDFQYRKMRLSVDNRLKNGLNADFAEANCDIIEQTKNQIDEYLEGKRKVFDLSLLMVGTDFQKAVWQSLMKVPYGSTATYLQLAQEINNKGAVRAVANANGANAIALIIPCHRIIGSDGTLVGYGGGLAIKKRLLNIENNKSSQQAQKSFTFDDTIDTSI